MTRHGDEYGELYWCVLALRSAIYDQVDEDFINETDVVGRERLILSWTLKVDISFSCAQYAETHACTSEGCWCLNLSRATIKG